MLSNQYRKSHLISTMGFPILVRWHLYIESGPLSLLSVWTSCRTNSPIVGNFRRHNTHLTSLWCIMGILHWFQVFLLDIELLQRSRVSAGLLISLLHKSLMAFIFLGTTLISSSQNQYESFYNGRTDVKWCFLFTVRVATLMLRNNWNWGSPWIL